MEDEDNDAATDRFWADFVKGKNKLNYNIRLK